MLNSKRVVFGCIDCKGLLAFKGTFWGKNKGGVNLDLVVVNNNLNKTNLAILKEKELDLFMAICLKLREEGTKKIELDLSELKDLSKYEGKDNQRFISDIKNVNKKLLKLYCEYETENEIGVFVLFTDYTIYKKEKKLVIQVNEKFKYILNELTENFTKFELNQFVELNSQYSKTIFRLLKQFDGTGWREFLLSDFRELLSIPPKYRISEIDKYVINEKIIEELKESFNNLKVLKIKDGRSVKKIRFEWDTVVLLPKHQEKENTKRVQKTVKEIKTDELIKKQEVEKENTKVKNQEINDLYNEFLKLPEEKKIEIEEKVYQEFLIKAEAKDNKIMRNIFEKSKKSLIVEEFKNKTEEYREEVIISSNLEVKILEKFTSNEKEMELLTEVGINPYTINEYNYSRNYYANKKTDKENAEDEINSYIFIYENNNILIDIKGNAINNFLIINPLYNKQSLLDNFNTKEVRQLLNPYIAKEMEKIMVKFVKEDDNKVYKVPVQKKLYSRNTIPNELLLDKKGRLLVGSAKESRIEKIVREQEKYLNDK